MLKRAAHGRGTWHLNPGHPKTIQTKSDFWEKLYVSYTGPILFLFLSFSFFFFLFSIPLIVFALLFSLPPINSRDSGPRSRNSRLFSPLPTTVRALHFFREYNSALSSLVDSRRIVRTHPIVGALDSWCHLRSKKSIRRFEPMTSTLMVFEVNH